MWRKGALVESPGHRAAADHGPLFLLLAVVLLIFGPQLGRGTGFARGSRLRL